jgi:hypothetical protein
MMMLLMAKTERTQFVLPLSVLMQVAVLMSQILMDLSYEPLMMMLLMAKTE